MKRRDRHLQDIFLLSPFLFHRSSEDGSRGVYGRTKLTIAARNLGWAACDDLESPSYYVLLWRGNEANDEIARS